MKKFGIIIFILFGLNANSQNPFSINANNQLVWTKIYNEILEIESQEIKLTTTKRTLAIYLRDIHSANMIVQKKGNKTRVLVKEIKSFTPLDNEPEGIDMNVINGKGEFRKFFIRRDLEILNEIIERSVNSIIEESNW